MNSEISLSENALLVEYEAAQSSAEHHDGLLWTVTGIIWSANLILFGILVQGPNANEFSPITAAASILGILMIVTCYDLAARLRTLKQHKYGRCKEIEGILGMKQHQETPWMRGSSWLTYRLVTLAFIVSWLLVLGWTVLS